MLHGESNLEFEVHVETLLVQYAIEFVETWLFNFTFVDNEDSKLKRKSRTISLFSDGYSDFL